LGIAAADVQFLFAGVDIKSLNNIQVNMLVQNVSNTPIVLNSMSLDLSVNGQSIGNAAVFPQVPITIQANSQQPIAISVAPDWLSIPSTVQTLLQSNSSNAKFEAVGTANVNNIPFPIDLQKSIAA
jgi:LEA14-like dessication related protein